jgi:hypothetical protein
MYKTIQQFIIPAAKVRKKRTRINRIGTNNIDNVPNSFPVCKEIRNFAAEINS